MAQLQKNSGFRQLSQAISSVVRSPGRVTIALWYRLYSWADSEQTTPVPENQMPGITPDDPSFKQISFTFSLIALAAHIARLEGHVTQEKYLAFREAFPLSGGFCKKIRSLFMLACENPVDYTHYVNQIKYAYPKNRALFKTLVDRLFRIAATDGSISAAEEKLLARIAHMLELSASDYMEIRDHHTAVSHAYHVLGVDRRTSPAIVKKRYRELMREYHPDKFSSKTLSPDVAQILRLKASEINDAYAYLTKKAA